MVLYVDQTSMWTSLRAAWKRRGVIFLVCLFVSSTANADFSLTVETKARSITRVDGKPAKIADDANRAPSASTGDESSSCQPYGRQSSASAVSNALETGRQLNSVNLALSTSVVASGGHYRTCSTCFAQQCVGVEGHDTGSSAQAKASGLVVVKFDELTLPGPYKIALGQNKSGASGNILISVRDSVGNSLSSDAAGSFTVQANPGALFQVVAEINSASTNAGGCCSEQDGADLRLDVAVERLAELAQLQTPFILGGTFTKEYPQVGLLTIQLLDGTVSPHCTGTLVGKRTVLTAAHCVAGDLKVVISEKRMRFVLGTSIDDPIAERFTVIEAPYPGKAPFVYKLLTAASGDITTEDDVAVAYLDKPSALTPLAIYRGSLPTLQSLIDSVEPLPFVGFGLFSVGSDGTGGSGSGKKRQAFVAINSQDKRTFDYGVNVAGQGVCKGDSGGPALIETSPQGWRVLGVTAYGARNCKSGRSMRVDAFVDWIDPLVKN